MRPDELILLLPSGNGSAWPLSSQVEEDGAAGI
jgi:hypothetical protein